MTTNTVKCMKNISATVGFLLVCTACFSEELAFSLRMGAVGSALLVTALLLTRFRGRKKGKKHYVARRNHRTYVEKIPELC